MKQGDKWLDDKTTKCSDCGWHGHLRDNAETEIWGKRWVWQMKAHRQMTRLQRWKYDTETQRHRNTDHVQITDNFLQTNKHAKDSLCDFFYTKTKIGMWWWLV